MARLIYDGDCGFCTSSARWIERRWVGSTEAVPWQQFGIEGLARLELTEAEVGRSAWWLAPGHPPEGDHLAIIRALQATRGWTRVLGSVLAVPPFRWVSAALYPVIARNRHRLPGGTSACKTQRTPYQASP
jgi:predicted DCC family thiol-disulfide oxidoreductase YuxK